MKFGDRNLYNMILYKKEEVKNTNQHLGQFHIFNGVFSHYLYKKKTKKRRKFFFNNSQFLILIIFTRI